MNLNYDSELNHNLISKITILSTKRNEKIKLHFMGAKAPPTPISNLFLKFIAAKL
jgi:hypothetical protein